MKKIITEQHKGRWSLKQFYLSRIARILPLYYLVLIFVLYAIPFFTKADFRNSVGFSILFDKQFFLWSCLTNFLPAFTGEYLKYGINIYWYIAVIMQFYILWPIIVSLVSSKVKKISICLIICSALSRFAFSAIGFSNMQIYHITLCRLDSLFIGVLVAFFVYEKRSLTYMLTWAIGAWAVALFSAVGLYFIYFRALILLSFTIASFLVAILLILIVSENCDFVKKVLSLKPFVLFGKYSFGIYIIHLYVGMLFVRLADIFVDIPRLLFVILSVLVSLFGGILSMHLIEQPIANLILKYSIGSRK